MPRRTEWSCLGIPENAIVRDDGCRLAYIIGSPFDCTWSHVKHGRKSNRTAVLFHMIEVPYTGTWIYGQKTGKWAHEMQPSLARCGPSQIHAKNEWGYSMRIDTLPSPALHFHSHRPRMSTDHHFWSLARQRCRLSGVQLQGFGPHQISRFFSSRYSFVMKLFQDALLKSLCRPEVFGLHCRSRFESMAITR
jgi:hypothetical protein